MAHKSVIAATAAVALASAGVLLYVASMGGFNSSKKMISDPVEGRETQSLENPAPPEQPAFPAPNSSTGNSSAPRFEQ